MTTVTFTIAAETNVSELSASIGQNYGAYYDLIAAKDFGEHTVEFGRDIGENVNDYADVMFFPATGRAAIDNNGGTLWTDAISVEDAIRRYREDDLSN